MGNKISTATGKAGSVEQFSVQPNDAMVQNVLLIWLDNNIDENTADYQNTMTELRHTVNTIKKYTNDEECIKFLETIPNEKICMIISGSLGQQIMPRVHNMFQVDSIFIFCGNKKRHEQWVEEWPKIKGIFTEITPICEALKQAAQQCEKDSMTVSFMTTNVDISKKNLDQLEPSFMYTQILKEILLTIHFEPKHLTEFTAHCRNSLADNEIELKNVRKFERRYRDDTSIWWYTCESFLYPMLNRALRVLDVNMIMRMGFFISNLHRHIKQLHVEQFVGKNFDKSFIVYRGQGMSKTDFEQMTKTEGGLMSFNNFLSTSRNRKVSLSFAHRAVKNPDLVGILFVMAINPAISTTPFASISDISYYKDKEDEMLFSMHTVFRIGEITSIDENHRLFQVQLTLTSDNDKDLRMLTDRIRQETFPNDHGWFRLGLVLLKMGHSDESQQVYEILLEQTITETAKAPIYNQLGLIKNRQERYEEALVFYEQSHEIYKRTLPPNHPDLAISYNNIGLVYSNLNEYSKALLSYKEALRIREESLPSNHPDLAASYNNIGILYRKMGEYPEALLFYEKALDIQQQSLPPTHPNLGSSCNNIGMVYEHMGNYSMAHSFYERAVDNGKHSLPSNHPALQQRQKNLEDVKKKL
jgi:Tfp pilus assembly protein PilF